VEAGGLDALVRTARDSHAGANKNAVAALRNIAKNRTSCFSPCLPRANHVFSQIPETNPHSWRIRVAWITISCCQIGVIALCMY